MQITITTIANVVMFALISGWVSFSADDPEMNRCSDHDVIYIVKEGDNLNNISAQYGSYLFWESIYVANADKVSNPDLIFPGQEIRIPYNVASFKEKKVAMNTVLDNPFCKLSDLPFTHVQNQFITRYNLDYLETRVNAEQDQERSDITEQEKKREYTDEESVLKDFRNAFNAVTQNKNQSIRTTENKQEKAQRESEKQLMLEIDGMVHDETRSKVGRDFYDVFYSYWQSPGEASNFTIRVAEQPSPNLGTIIYVTVNQTETFRMRLQPRYEMIQEAGKYAVRQTYGHLQNNTQKNIIY